MCSHCTRDLVLFKPLALRLQTLAEEVAQLRGVVQQQALTLNQRPSQVIEAAAQSYAEMQEASPAPAAASARATALKSWFTLLGTVLLTIAAIGLCHWVLLFVYDTPPLFLRLLTITLPALTGYVCARRSGLGWLSQLLQAHE